MASLDDTIISRQNLTLLDNVTNYRKPALDYFHHHFNSDKLEMPTTWTLLLKMRKHKLLRLPSCAIEDDTDYNTYLMRLHHCLWRRWSMEHYKLEKLKIDPLSINWNKETDITVLYGPDLTGGAEEADAGALHPVERSPMEKQCSVDLDEDEINCNGARAYSYSSSVDSNVSSIFDDSNVCTKTHSNSSAKSLKFCNTVLRRDIDRHGAFQETEIQINDASKVSRHSHRRRKQHRGHRSHHHGHHHKEACDDDIFVDQFLDPSVPMYGDDLQLEMNIHKLKDSEVCI